MQKCRKNTNMLFRCHDENAFIFFLFSFISILLRNDNMIFMSMTISVRWWRKGEKKENNMFAFAANSIIVWTHIRRQTTHFCCCCCYFILNVISLGLCAYFYIYFIPVDFSMGFGKIILTTLTTIWAHINRTIFQFVTIYTQAISIESSTSSSSYAKKKELFHCDCM